ncbi:transcriptional regulator [Clostridium phage HM T]|uniref:Putative prophage lambdaCh01, transcriptional regulator n=1 Tax=Clostridium saccharoperbutylacetonicum N1-4(HMT) TaxID=931276 RepID=M1MEJ0_9CLOT|nr:helix-turn-helix transcriptional regulator [Clostridium saccharoperbutylacetonicum]AMB17421.1 transcriptional regulator [Clostridium phage HM T]AGF54773.1 putative prophage lambdaCh01, transcriptional regulator [Clostridium saccharoperbutylacetonicum N1-4(HMT)]NRT58706.1 transcriptional regulator with XRE-family HTH domain [Clostridium saccharoperbutylacetonicum]NSB27895.1 transcriptional regulator with XRE-family HTH domain [Clostridium saccharoperbutylacetonicum]NSB41378.1 transcriptional
MVQNYRNIYQIARENTSLTQEKSSELLDISVDSLRAYEGGKRTPPENIVIDMAKIYNRPYLILQHYQKTLIGKELFPNIQIKYLAEAVLTFLDELEDLETIKKLIVKISRDGQIDENEKDDWEMIMKILDEMVCAIITIKFAR